MTTTRTGRSSGPGTWPPDDGPGEAAALRAFESANDRAATPAERKLLRDLAARFEPVAATVHQERDDVPNSGWGWLEAAVWDAVEAGSAFVAPRRVREILLRWERDGFPQPRDPGPPRPEPPRHRPSRPAPPDDITPPRALAPLFTIEEVGLSNRQVWAATLAELARRGDVGRADVGDLVAAGRADRTGWRYLARRRPERRRARSHRDAPHARPAGGAGRDDRSDGRDRGWSLRRESRSRGVEESRRASGPAHRLPHSLWEASRDSTCLQNSMAGHADATSPSSFFSTPRLLAHSTPRRPGSR